MENLVGQVIESEKTTLTEEMVDRFNLAIGAQCTKGISPTFVTVFRETVNGWLERLKVDMRNLLHTEQEYEYLKPLRVGMKAQTRSTFISVKERTTSGGKMQWVRLRTECFEGEEVYIITNTTFLIRERSPKS